MSSTVILPNQPATQPLTDSSSSYDAGQQTGVVVPGASTGVKATGATSTNQPLTDDDSTSTTPDYSASLGTKKVSAYEQQLQVDPNTADMQKALAAAGANPVPSTAAVAKIANTAGSLPGIQALVTQTSKATSDLANGTINQTQYLAAIPSGDQVQQTMADANATSVAQGGDGVFASGDTQAIIMYVFTQAKTEMNAEKADDLKKMQKYSTMMDLMTNNFSNMIVPAQQELADKTAAEKDNNKKTNVTISMDPVPPDSIDLDNITTDANGNAQLISKEVANPAKPGTFLTSPREVSQTDLGQMIDNQGNMKTQIQQRLQSTQTHYSGLDNQDSTFSNILVAVQKTFNDSASAIVRNGV